MANYNLHVGGGEDLADLIKRKAKEDPQQDSLAVAGEIGVPAQWPVGEKASRGIHNVEVREASGGEFGDGGGSAGDSGVEDLLFSASEGNDPLRQNPVVGGAVNCGVAQEDERIGDALCVEAEERRHWSTNLRNKAVVRPMALPGRVP